MSGQPPDLVPRDELATANASLRWWHSSLGHQQIKGSVTLRKYKLGNLKIVFHDLAYTGHWVGCHDDKPISHTLMLPLSSFWRLTHSKVRSENARARVLMIEIKDPKTDVPFNYGVQKVQITVPFSGNGKKEKEFIQHFVLAASSCGGSSE